MFRATTCVAGVLSIFNLRVMDLNGKLIYLRIALLEVEIRVPGEEPEPAFVRDYGDGNYAVSYTVTKAGPLEVALIVSRITSRAERILHVKCRVDVGGGSIFEAWRFQPAMGTHIVRPRARGG